MSKHVNSGIWTYLYCEFVRSRAQRTWLGLDICFWRCIWYKMMIAKYCSFWQFKTVSTETKFFTILYFKSRTIILQVNLLAYELTLTSSFTATLINLQIYLCNSSLLINRYYWAFCNFGLDKIPIPLLLDIATD